MTQYMQEAGAMKQAMTDEQMHALSVLLVAASGRITPLTMEGAQSILRLITEAPNSPWTALPPAAQAGTPGAQWREKGEPDPHGKRYDCERAELCMGTLTDDELANAAFLNYDHWPSMEDLLAGKAHPPIAYMTAVKDRIRWLSRKLAAANEGTLTAGKQGGDGVEERQPEQEKGQQK